VKSYNNLTLPLWNVASVHLQRVFSTYRSILGEVVEEIAKEILTVVIN
jgi:hypothetical protein